MLEHVGNRAPIHTSLESKARLGLQPVTPRGPAHAPRREVSAFEEHTLRVVSDFAVETTHDAGQSARTLAVADHQIVLVEPSFHPIERGEGLAGSRTSNDDLATPHAIEIERMQRLTPAEQQQVRHVNGVADGPHTELLEAPAQPGGRRRDLHIEHRGRSVVRAALRVLVFDADQRGKLGFRSLGEGFRLGQGERKLEQRRHVPRDPHMTEGIWTIRRDTNLEHEIRGLWLRFEQRRTRREARGRQDEDPFRLLRHAELGFADQHPLARHTTNVARRERNTQRRQHAAQRRQEHTPAGVGNVRRTANDALLVALSAIHGDQAQTLARRVGLDASNLRNHDRCETRTELRDRLHLEPGMGQAIGHFGGGHVERWNELPKPSVRNAHGAALLPRRFTLRNGPLP